MKQETPKWIALIILLTAPFLSVVDIFIINVAIPAIKKGTHATDGEVQLVIAGYLLGYAAFLITGGRAGDYFGRKKVFFWGMLFFTLLSCLCGLSQNGTQLNITRLFQGISSAFMVPQTLSYIQILFKDEKERAKALGLFGVVVGLASIIGQVLGGFLAGSHFVIEGWRLIFFINLPIGLLALLAALKYLNETHHNLSQRFDYTGVLILTSTLVLFIFPLTQGREAGWPWWSFLMLILSFFMAMIFIKDQQIKLILNQNPLIDMSLFKIQDFNLGLLAALFHFMAHTSYLLIIAVYLQSGLGFSALECGLFFVLPGTFFTLSAFITIKLVVRFGKRVIQAGVLLIVISLFLHLWLLKPHVEKHIVFLLMGLYGLGNGLVLPSLLNVALKNISAAFAGAAAGVYSTFQQTASAIGVSVIGGLFFFLAASVKQGNAFEKAFFYSIVTNICIFGIVSIFLYLLPVAKSKTTSMLLPEM